jgi:type VI secretion system secreted protein VgrG
MPLSNVHVKLLGGDPSLTEGNVVARYDLREAIGELSELVIELLLTNADIDMAQLVGVAAYISFTSEPHLTQFQGIVRTVRQLSSETTGVSPYELTVVPPLWLTTLRTDHRIFQDMNVPDIVNAVLAKYGSIIPAPTQSLVRTHAPREYCVQYGETDYDFIMRLLAEDGISSYFRPEGQGASPATVWVLDDDTTLGDATVTTFFSEATGQVQAQPHVFAVEGQTSLVTSEVTLRDYDYTKPSFILEDKAKSSDILFGSEAGIETYSFAVGQFQNDADGQALAKRHLDEARALRRVLSMRADFSVGAGTRLSVSDLPGYSIEQGEKALLAVRTRTVGATTVASGGSAVVDHRMECTPQSHPFQPKRRPKPRIWGTQTAFVVGEQAGVDEIDVDELGRVKVEFRWDRRDLHEGKPTRRVRASQGWANAGYGFVMLPRVNEEVIVAYLDGDPDEPIIIGRVHNAVVTSPLKLPDEKTVSVWRSKSSPSSDGYNEIRMEDKAGQEKLSVHAQKDLSRIVEHNETVQVKSAHSTSAGSISLSSGSTFDGHSKTAMSLSTDTTFSGHSKSDMSLDTSATFTAHATSDMTHKSDASVDVNAAAKVNVIAGDTIRGEAASVLLKGRAVTSIHGEGAFYLHSNCSINETGGVSIDMSAPFITMDGSSDVIVDGGTIIISSKGGVSIYGANVAITGSEVKVTGSPIKLNC